MALTNMIPQLTAAQILRTLEDNLVAKQICDLKAAGEIKKQGDSIRFPGLADPTVHDYTGTVSYEELTDSSVTLVVDQAKYFAFEVDDIEAYQAAVDAKSSQATRAAYMLAAEADKYVLGLYTEAQAAFDASVTVTEANILSTIAQLEKKLREQGAGEEEIFLVAPPFVKMFLQLAGVKFQVNSGTNGTGALAFTNELGISLYISNFLTTGETGECNVLAGTKNAIVYADQILDTETIRREEKFADAVRGLHVYGAKVVKPAELFTAALVEGTSAGI